MDHIFEKFGCATPTTPKVVQSHDFIEKIMSKRALIFKKCLHLYENHHSLQAIATELGVSKSVVRTTLLQEGIELRGHSYKALKQSRRKQTMSDRTAPYGYCLIQGKRVEDPREQVILRLILKWSSEGLSHCGIANRLNNKNFKPRKAAKWSQPTIGFIIKRHQKK